MAVTVSDIMREINNFFEGDAFPDEASYTIEASGKISPSVGGNYVAINGSNCHDGVFPIANGLIDFGESVQRETFKGKVWELHVPIAFKTLCEEIIAFDSKTPVSAYTSESFGGYSYTRNAAADTWQKAYAKRLNPYRRMFTEVKA